MNTVVASMFIVSGGIGMVLNFFLATKRIPMNHWYGIRIAKAFQSEANWWAINEYGGKVLMCVCATWMVWGVLGLIGPLARLKSYPTIGVVLLGAGLTVGILMILQFARRF